MSGLFESIASNDSSSRRRKRASSKFHLTRVASIVSDYEAMFKEATADEFSDLWSTISPGIKQRLAENNIPAKEIATVRDSLASAVKTSEANVHIEIDGNLVTVKSFPVSDAEYEKGKLEAIGYSVRLVPDPIAMHSSAKFTITEQELWNLLSGKPKTGMFFENRAYAVGSVSSPEVLADKLMNYSWTSCTAFRLGNILYVNDQSSADGAGEWAIVKITSETPEAIQGVQVESITFGWIDDIEKALKHINAMQDGSGHFSNTPVTIAMHPAGSCVHCASKTAQYGDFAVWGVWEGEADEAVTHVDSLEKAIDTAQLALTKPLFGGSVLPVATYVKQVGEDIVLWDSRQEGKTSQYDYRGLIIGLQVGDKVSVQTGDMNDPLFGIVRGIHGDGQVFVFLPHVITASEAPGFDTYEALSGGMLVTGDLSMVMERTAKTAQADEPLSTSVIFRQWIDDGCIIAIFPELKEPNGMVMMYEHVGQHGAGDMAGVEQITIPAKPEDYADLKAELEGRGYRFTSVRTAKTARSMEEVADKVDWASAGISRNDDDLLSSLEQVDFSSQEGVDYPSEDEWQEWERGRGKSSSHKTAQASYKVGDPVYGTNTYDEGRPFLGTILKSVENMSVPAWLIDLGSGNVRVVVESDITGIYTGGNPDFKFGQSSSRKTASFTGTIEDIMDEGTIVMFTIQRSDGTIDRVAGDGNMTRAALADSGLGLGDVIEYDFSDWGGLEWFAPA